jgi:hypothetical protein
MTRGREETGVYVYCITEGEPVAAAAGLHPCRPVYSLAHEDLVAVASRVPLDEFGEEALSDHLGDAGWLEREVRAHERVIEKVMETRTVLPMKFYTIFRTEEGVRALLESDQDQFRRALARLRGRQEWEVKLYSEPAGAVPQAARDQTGLSGKGYLLRKRAEKIAAQQAMDEVRRQAQRSYEKLARRVERIQLKPVKGAGSPNAPTLILDAVCLVPESAFDSCYQELQALGKELADKGLRFQLSGPWPPYHFISWAQENVGLP